MLVVGGNSSTEVSLEAVNALQEGGVVCFPTESFYGLAVNALNSKAVARLLALKGDRGNSPIGLIVSGLEQVAMVCEEIDPISDRLARQFWPGPLSLVLPALTRLPEALVNGHGGVALRVSPHAEASRLVRDFGSPITATSANPSGKPPPTSVSQARAYFGDAVDVYVDGGESPGGRPSTVAEVLDGRVVVHRQGAVDLSDV